MKKSKENIAITCMCGDEECDRTCNTMKKYAEFMNCNACKDDCKGIKCGFCPFSA
jgi:hypothetical protein